VSNNTNASIRRLLDDIDIALSKGDDGARDLWYILTALRGPDDLEGGGKNDTVRVRSLVFPKTAANTEYGFLNRAQMVPVEAGGGPFSYPPSTNEHFDYHLYEAFQSLGRLSFFPQKETT
jgi:hypothetical protein